MEFKETVVIDAGEEKIDGHDQLTITVEYNRTENGFEIFDILFNEYDTTDTFKIESWAMDISREIEKEGNGDVLEFIWLMYIKTLRADIDEMDAKDFFENISD